MNSVRTLYFFEMRKIFMRKIVWITAGIMLLVNIVTVGSSLFGDYYVDGVKIDTHYHMFQVDRAYQQKLDGLAIDQELLESMQEGYARIPSEADRYSITEEYQRYARPYSAIFNCVRQFTGMTVTEARSWQADEEDLYAQRELRLEKMWEDNALTEREKDFWRGWEEKLEKPLIFRYTESYITLHDYAYTVGLMLLVTITVCLSGVFPEEHVRKTDQLILSSRQGRAAAYWAKFLAGVSFSVVISLLSAVVAFLTAFVCYGPEGFSGAVQLWHMGYSYPLSMGEAVLIVYCMIMLAGVFTGAFVMMFSELVHNSIGTLALVMGTILLQTLVTVPEQYRVLGQIWSYFPGNFVGVWSIFSLQTVPLFGKCLLAWQFVPALYLLAGGAFALVGRKVFTGYQVSGR